MKIKSAFFCQNCGYESVKWAGKCPNCQQWNTFVEEKVAPKNSQSAYKKAISSIWQESSPEMKKAVRLHEVSGGEEVRWLTPDKELNRSLGGGLVPGSLTLVAGEPGIGKSTLFLQVALSWNTKKILYISGEESAYQIKMRADRLSIDYSHVFLLTQTDTQSIFKEIVEIQPDWIIIDSIQTMETPLIDSAPGTVSQVRETTGEFMKFAKQTGIPVTLIGHITKDGSIAGPKILEHMVDTVLQFEGDRHFSFRILRTVKNRFGSTSEIGIYEMNANGLKGIDNPSDVMLSPSVDELSGVAIGTSLEGIRPLMVETQALVSQSVYGTPQRTINGFDLKRLQLLLAVLDKRGGLQFGSKDVFVNITGGIKIEDPAIDLAIVAALLSSYQDVIISRTTVFIGEIGLSGEIRPVSRIEQRLTEAEKLGIKTAYVPEANVKGVDLSKFDMAIKPISKVSEVYEIVM